MERSKEHRPSKHKFSSSTCSDFSSSSSSLEYRSESKEKIRSMRRSKKHHPSKHKFSSSSCSNFSSSSSSLEYRSESRNKIKFHPKASSEQRTLWHSKSSSSSCSKSSSTSSSSSSSSSKPYVDVPLRCKSLKPCPPKPCPPKPKVFGQSCPPKICEFCEGKEARIILCTNNAQEIQWQVSKDGGCKFKDIPGANSPLLCFKVTKCDSGNLYRPIVRACLCKTKCHHKKIECKVKCENTTKCKFRKLCEPKKCEFRKSCESRKCEFRKSCESRKCESKKCEFRKPCGKKKCCDSHNPCKKCDKWFLLKDKCKKWEQEAFFICQSVKLKVIPKPRIIKPLMDKTVQVGETVVFKIKAKPKDVKYVWKKNGVIIPRENSPKLIIPSVTGEDSGVYTVIVCNKCGSASDCAVLTVETTSPCPTSVEICGPTRACQGSQVTYSIPCLGDEFKYIWFVTGDAEISGPHDGKEVSILFSEKVENGSPVDGSFTLTLHLICNSTILTEEKEITTFPPLQN